MFCIEKLKKKAETGSRDLHRRQALKGLRSNMKRKHFRIHLNIGTIIFGILFIYIFATLILYVTRRHVETYQVISGPLSGNDTYTALISRDETVVQSSTDGYVNYFINGSQRVSNSDLICVVSDSKDIASNAVLDNADSSKLRELTANSARSFDSEKFDEVYDLQYNISNILWSSAAAQTTAGNFYNSASDGMASVYTDGYEYMNESELTADMGQNSDYNPKRLNNHDKVMAGTPIYRMINSEEWSICFPITDEQTLKLASIDNIKVKFLTDNNTETGKLTFFTNNDQRFGKITFTSGMYRYINERFIDVEILSNLRTGLKIPSSSVVTKEFYTVPASFMTESGDGNETGFLKETKDKDGNTSTVFVPATLYAGIKNGSGEDETYYVDMDTFKEGDILVKTDSTQRYTVKTTDKLEGVYCVNKGYSVFRKISIIDKNSEFCIVEEGTRYGLSLYDYIVKDGASVKENEIVN